MLLPQWIPGGFRTSDAVMFLLMLRPREMHFQVFLFYCQNEIPIFGRAIRILGRRFGRNGQITIQVFGRCVLGGRSLPGT